MLEFTQLDRANSTHEPWYAVQVRTGREGFVGRLLEDKGYQVFLPIMRQCKQRKGRAQALFPGYLFCTWRPSTGVGLIVTTPYVLRLVGHGNAPAPIPVREIECLRRVLETGLKADPLTGVASGVPIYIATGPLRGVEGTLGSHKGQSRLMVWITLINRAVSVEVDRASVRPLPAPGMHNAAVRQASAG